MLRLLQAEEVGAMGRTIPHRELRNNSSAVLREVQEGESVAITNHGEVVAILMPPDSRRSSLRVRRARTRGGLAGLERIRLDTPVQELLDDLRGER